MALVRVVASRANDYLAAATPGYLVHGGKEQRLREAPAAVRR